MNMPRSVQVIVLALAIGGCAVKTPPSLSGDAREQLGRIGVVAVAFAPEVSFSGPTALGGFGGGSKGALSGLGLGVLGGAGCFLTLGFGVDFCAIAVSTPYFIGRWSVEGALKAVPEQERHHGREPVDAMFHAASIRMRPLLMTALSASLGLLPAAISTGIGSQVQRPLATVIVGGMLIGPFMLLIAVPALRMFFLGKEAQPAAVEEDLE